MVSKSLLLLLAAATLCNADGFSSLLPSVSLWPESKFASSSQGKSCRTVYDKVWREECKTAYEDACSTDTVEKCASRQLKECVPVLEQECSTAFEDRCTSIPVPSCQITKQRHCSSQRVCNTVTDRVCHSEPKRICKTKHEKVCDTKYEKVCRQVPVEVVDTIDDEPRWKRSIILGKVKKAKKHLKKLSEHVDAPTLVHGGIGAPFKKPFPVLSGLGQQYHQPPVEVVEEVVYVDEPANRWKRTIPIGPLSKKLHLKKKVLKKAVVANKLGLLPSHSAKGGSTSATPVASVIETKYAEPVTTVSTRTECSEEPREHCVKVPKEHCHEEPYETCKDIPQEVCTEEPSCRDVPLQSCTLVPKQKCIKVPTKQCKAVPRQQCRTVPKRHCEQVPRETCKPVPRKVCAKKEVPSPRTVCDGPAKVTVGELEW